MSAKWVDDIDQATPAPTPTPAPAPAKPTPAPATVPAGHSWAGRILACLAIVATIAVVVGTLEYSRPSELESIGRAYPQLMGQSYAWAWEDGAKLLDAGQPVATALGVVHSSWEANRLKAFAENVAPKFAAIVPEGEDESKITIEQRRALAAAWREFAKGLGK